MIMGKDCFVVNIACDLESYAVALFCIYMILRGSLWFPVVYISSCKISFETLLFLTGAVTALQKNHRRLGIITTVYPGTWSMLPSFPVQVRRFVLVLTTCWDEAQMLSTISAQPCTPWPLQGKGPDPCSLNEQSCDCVCPAVQVQQRSGVLQRQRHSKRTHREEPVKEEVSVTPSTAAF